MQFRPGTAAHALSGSSLGAVLNDATGLYEVKLASGTSVAAALAAYQQDATVLKAEPDYLLGTSATTNDSRLGEQWALNNTSKPSADINAPQAWDVARGSTRIAVAVMDTGVDYTHPDLYRNIWINQGEIPASRRANLTDIDGDGLITFRDLNDSRNQGYGKITDQNGNGYIDGGDLLRAMNGGYGGWADRVSNDGDNYVDDICGWDFFASDNNPSDDYGHGTHVAGTIGATANNGIGVAGVAWDVQLMPVKFLGSGGSGSVSQFIAALNYSVAKGAKISNNSWSGAGYSTVLRDAIDYARSRGQVFVAAAGNFGSNNDTQPTYPATFGLDNIIAVAATDRNDNLASFSDYGARTVQIAAPGVDILSTTPGGGYGVMSGTSMATPQVSGVVALVWGQHPDWSYKQVIDRVLGSADKLSSLSGKTVTGGRVNAAAAVAPTASISSVAPLRIVDSIISGSPTSSFNQITVRFDKAVSVGTFTPADVYLVGTDGNTIAVSSVRAVAGSGDALFTLSFAAQTRGGYYKVRVGPEVYDTRGGKLITFNSSLYFQPKAAPQTTTPTPAPVTAPPAANALRIQDSTASGSTAGTYNKITVQFDRAISVGTFTPADVYLVGPDGKAIAITSITGVAGSGDRRFVLAFAAQTRGGYYKLRVGPEVSDPRGIKMTVFNSSLYLNATAPVTPTVPPPSPPAANALRIQDSTASGSTAGTYNKITVQFDRAVSVGTFTPADVYLVGPDGGVITVSSVRVVSGSSDRRFDLNFATQTRGGYYKLRVGPEVSDPRGVKMTVFNSSLYLKKPTGTTSTPTPTPTPPKTASGTYSSASAASITPGGRAVSLVSVPDDIKVRTVKIKVNLTHPNLSDLYIHVTGPGGIDVVLSNRKGGSTANLVGTLFDDAASKPVALGRGPYNGSYKPDSTLSNLTGTSARGLWKLWVEDRGGVNRGTLTSWQVIVN